MTDDEHYLDSIIDTGSEPPKPGDMVRVILELMEQEAARKAREPHGPHLPTPLYMTHQIEEKLFAKASKELQQAYLKHFKNWWCWPMDLDDNRYWHYGYPCELKDHPLHGNPARKYPTLEDCFVNIDDVEAGV